MNRVKYMVFRELTTTDYFNINKPPGTEPGGGGQSYIDISTSSVTLDDWHTFFEPVSQVSPAPAGGPAWDFDISSLGSTTGPQEIRIGQRRPATVSIRSQKMESAQSERVYAWHPDHTDFPSPRDPEEREDISNLRIYIVRLDNDTYWAGFVHRSETPPDWDVNRELERLFNQSEGFIEFEEEVYFDRTDPHWPFRLISEEQDVQFDMDTWSDENMSPEVRTRSREVRLRNKKAVSRLKQLYDNHCQLTGTEYTFRKKDGDYYSEAHHLIPIGEGGADDVKNIIIVSPLIHRMLHYAEVEGIDLENISNDRLDITINGESYTIEWHPEHARVVQGSA